VALWLSVNKTPFFKVSAEGPTDKKAAEAAFCRRLLHLPATPLLPHKLDFYLTMPQGNVFL
jgi:hypothetical protein